MNEPAQSDDDFPLYLDDGSDFDIDLEGQDCIDGQMAAKDDQ